MDATYLPAMVSLGFLASGGLYFLAWRQLRNWVPAAEETVALKRDAEISELQRQLAQAGFTHPEAATILMRLRLLAALIGGAVGYWLGVMFLSDVAKPTQTFILVAGTCALLCYILPTFYVDRRRAAMKRRIARAVPDAVDFLQVCMEAGQSVDAALIRVTNELETMHPELAAKFRNMLDALAAGASREAAFEQLATDTDNDDLRQFSNMMEQAVTMGSSVSHTLRVFTNDLRDQRLRATEARANVLPTKMTLGSMIFTVPPLLILLLSPAILRLMDIL